MNNVASVVENNILVARQLNLFDKV